MVGTLNLSNNDLDVDNQSKGGFTASLWNPISNNLIVSNLSRHGSKRPTFSNIRTIRFDRPYTFIPLDRQVYFKTVHFRLNANSLTKSKTTWVIFDKYIFYRIIMVQNSENGSYFFDKL